MSTVLKVSQINTYLKSLMDSDMNLKNIYITGEISNFTNHYRTGHLYFTLKDEKSAINDKKRVIEKIKKVDKRKFFLNYNIKIYDDEENYLGIYNIKTGKYINKYEEKIDKMTYSFAVIVHKTTSDLSGIKYLYYKKILYK